MKKRLLAVLCAALMMLSGCVPEMKQAEECEQIYASFFPIYALTGMIINDIPGIELKYLVQPQDDCLRLYDLSDWDASVLAYDADVVVIGGYGLESFESALYSFGENGPAVISANIPARLIQQENYDGGENTDHFTGTNPFLYMSVGGARQMISVISESLAMLYPDMAEEISEGYYAADDKLAQLEEQIAVIRNDVDGSNVILMNEALIYTAQDCGLNVVYRYDRESGTTLYGQSLDTAVNTFEETGAEVILIEKQAPAELVNALTDAGYTVVPIDIMSSYPADAIPDRYIDVQLANISAIADAFR